MSVENTSDEQLLNEYQSLLASIGQEIPVAEPVIQQYDFVQLNGLGVTEYSEMIRFVPVEETLTSEMLTDNGISGLFRELQSAPVTSGPNENQPPDPSWQFQRFLVETGHLTQEQIRQDLSNGRDISGLVVTDRSNIQILEESPLSTNDSSNNLREKVAPKINYSNRSISVTLENNYNSNTYITHPSHYSQHSIEIDYRILEMAFNNSALEHLVSYHKLDKDTILEDWKRYLKTGQVTDTVYKILGELCHRIYENKLHQKYYELKDIEIERLDSIKNACERVFPGNWDIDYNCRREFSQENINQSSCSSTWKLYIRFPKITITNSKKETVEINDLIIVIEFRRDFLKFKNAYIYGTVFSATNKLYASKFRHSHLPSADDFTSFNTFCLGSSDVASIMMRLSTEPFNPYLFETFLYQLDAYVKWESLEGGPYYRMNTIGTDRNNNRSLTPPININTYFKQCIDNKLISKSLVIKSENGINLFDISIETLNDLLLTHLLGIYSKELGLQNKIFTLILRERNNDNDYSYASHHVNLSTRSISDRDRGYKLPFRGNDLKLNIITENIENKLGDICINPLILKYVREQASRGIQNFFTKNYRIEE